MSTYKKDEPKEPHHEAFGFIFPKTLEDHLGAILHVAKDMIEYPRPKMRKERAYFIIHHVRKAWDLIPEEQKMIVCKKCGLEDFPYPNGCACCGNIHDI